MENEFWLDFIKEFGEMDTLRVAQIVAIQLTLKIKSSDLEKGGFENRLKNKVRKKVLWRLSKDDFDRIWKIWSCTYDYSLEINIPDGMGGHIHKTLRQIFNEKE